MLYKTTGILAVLGLAACFEKSEKKAEVTPAIAEKMVVHIASDFDYYPFVYREPKDTDSANPNANKKGMEVDIIMELSKRLDFNIIFEELKFDEIIAAVAAGRPGADGAIGGITITPGRQSKVLFTTPIYRSPLVTLVPHHKVAEDEVAEVVNVYEPKDNPDTQSTTEDIEYELFTVSDPDFADFASEQLADKYKKAKIKVANKALTADVLDAFENSKSGMYLTDRAHAEYLMKNFPNLKIEEEFADKLTLGGGLPIAFVFNPKHEALVIRINEELGKMETDGTLKKIFDAHQTPDTSKTTALLKPSEETAPKISQEKESAVEKSPVEEAIEHMIEEPFEPAGTLSE